MIVRLALRNALRNRRRSLFTLLSLLIGVGLLVISQSFVDGIERTLVANEIDSEHSHVRIVPQGYLEEEDYYPIDRPLPNAAQIATFVMERFPGAFALSRMGFRAEVGDGQKTLRVRGMTANITEYAKMFRVGDLADIGNGQRCFVGSGIAGAFGWTKGDTLEIQTKTIHGTLNSAKSIQIVELLRSSHPLVDDFTVLLPNDVGQTLLDSPEGRATEVLVRLPNPDDAEQVAALVQNTFPGVVAQTWRQKTQYLIDINNLRRGAFQIIVMIILLISAAGVANTTLMSAFERTTEIGTMLALGMRRGTVVWLLVTETLMIALVGSAVGAGLGSVVSGWFTTVGIEFPEIPVEAGAAIPMPPLLYFAWRPEITIFAVGLGVTVAFIAALWPALRSSRVDPITALRGEA
ncbi:MAG: ABC transporter permease [Myxococcales bacterium]|nr:ABC transporter permease [Myxococcales bacterium]